VYVALTKSIIIYVSKHIFTETPDLPLFMYPARIHCVTRPPIVYMRFIYLILSGKNVLLVQKCACPISMTRRVYWSMSFVLSKLLREPLGTWPSFSPNSCYNCGLYRC